MNQPQLRALAKQMGLKAGGTNEVIRERIRAAGTGEAVLGNRQEQVTCCFVKRKGGPGMRKKLECENERNARVYLTRRLNTGLERAVFEKEKEQEKDANPLVWLSGLKDLCSPRTSVTTDGRASTIQYPYAVGQTKYPWKFPT